MEECKMAGKVTVIPATLDRFASKPISRKTKRRVAAYARVSTDEEEQLNSYEAQVRYYSEYIKSHPDWEFVEVYSDEGISGTHTEKRAGFRRMMDDAIVNGKIDLILTKSVSRFARNTVDSLTSIRELKAKGVEVYFEKENIWTFDSKGEMLLTIMSSIAQEESRSISENVLWGLHKRFENGQYWCCYSSLLGYDKGDDGRLVINEEQAKYVRYIYRRFLEGASFYQIGKEMEGMGVKTPRGSSTWSQNYIESILHNEKYAGDAMMQKTYKKDLLSKREKNNGEVRRFYVEDAHEAIIPRDDFEMVQRELKNRKEKPSKHHSTSIFADKVFCGYCGSAYGSKVWHSTDKYCRIVWRCNAKYKIKGNRDRCRSPHVSEEQIKDIFMKAANILIKDKADAVRRIESIRDSLLVNDSFQKSLDEAETEVSVVSGLMEEYVRSTVLTESEVENGRYAELQTRYEAAVKNAEKARNAISDRKVRARELERFLDEVRKLDGAFLEFSKEAWLGLCDRITLKEIGMAAVRFRSGVEIEVEY